MHGGWGAITNLPQGRRSPMEGIPRSRQRTGRILSKAANPAGAECSLRRGAGPAAERAPKCRNSANML